MHHGAAAGGEHQITLAHQFIRGLKAGCFDADHQILRCAHLLQRATHQVTDFFVGQLGPRVRCDNDRVAAFDSVNAFDHGSGFRVGRWRQRADHAQWLGENADIAFRIFLNDTDGLVMNDVQECRARLTLDLQEFTVVVAELGFINGELSNLFRHAGSGHGPHHCSDQRVDLLLRVVFDLFLRGARSRNQIRDKCLGVTIILRHDGPSPNYQKNRERRVNRPDASCQ